MMMGLTFVKDPTENKLLTALLAALHYVHCNKGENMTTTENFQQTTQTVLVVGNYEKGFRVLDTTNLPSPLPLDEFDMFYLTNVEVYTG